MIEVLEENYKESEVSMLLFTAIHQDVKDWILSRLKSVETIKKLIVRSNDDLITRKLILKINEEHDLLEIYPKSKEFLMHLILEKLTDKTIKWLIENETSHKHRKQAIYTINDVEFLKNKLKTIQGKMESDIYMKQLDKMDITVAMTLVYEIEEAISFRINQLTIQ
jgi:hypothetical protein